MTLIHENVLSVKAQRLGECVSKLLAGRRRVCKTHLMESTRGIGKTLLELAEPERPFPAAVAIERVRQSSAAQLQRKPQPTP